MNLSLFTMRPDDFGPIYAETDLSRTIVEPFNTVSNIGFLILVIYWWRRLKWGPVKSNTILFSLPVILIGFIGGTVFHATRSHSLWLILDFMPIALTVLGNALLLWFRIYRIKKLPVLLCLPLMIALFALIKYIPVSINARISIGYMLQGAFILAPAYVLCILSAYRGMFLLTAAVCSFAVAISFRQFDAALGATLLPMGSHFLWHIFGALSAHLLIRFIYEIEHSSQGR